MTRHSFVRTAPILLAISLAIFVIGGESSIQAAPQLPHAFFGKVSVGAVPAASSLRIEARINNVNYAESVRGGVSTSDTTTGSNGTYGSEQNFQVCADDPDTSDIEGGADGDVITFFVEGVQAQTLSPDDGTAVGPVLFQTGDTKKLDLSIPSLGEATLSATPSEFACTTFGSEPTPTATPVTAGGGGTSPPPPPPPPPAPTPTLTPIPVRTLLPEPEVVSETTALVEPGVQTQIQTPDGQVQVTVPADALPLEVGDMTVEIELKRLDVTTVPAPPGETVFVRAVEVNTIVDGGLNPIDYTQAVELSFPLIPDDLAIVGGDTSKLGVLRFNQDTGEWESVPVIYESTPPPAGRLVATLDRFSLFAVSVFQPVELPEPMPVATPEPPTPTMIPTPSPIPTLAPPTPTALPVALVTTPTPAPTATPVQTATPLPPTPTVLAAVPTTLPTATPQATETATPPTPTPAVVAAAAAPAFTPMPTPAPELFTPSEDGGGLSTTTIIILVIVGLAVAGGIFSIGKAVLARRRPS